MGWVLFAWSFFGGKGYPNSTIVCNTCSKGELSLVQERAVAMLTLTAIHDIMKNSTLLPIVQPAHAPFNGYVAGFLLTTVIPSQLVATLRTMPEL
eukprot:6464555-Amphidinium_carterae.1